MCMKNSILFVLIAVSIFGTHVQTIAQTSSRLIAEADSSQFYDSVYYVYSGGRGGDLTHTMKYDRSFSITPLGTDTQKLATWQTFDSHNNLLTFIERITEPGCGIPGFVDVSKDSNLYDVHNNLIASYTFEGTSTPGTWVPQDSTFYSYDSRNNLIVSLKPGVQKDSLVYDAGNNLLTQILFYWDGGKGRWVESGSSTYTYSGGLLQSNYNYVWIMTDSTFVTYSGTLYYYNSSNKLIKQVQLQTDPFATIPGTLVYKQVDSNLYDAANDMTYSYHAQYDAFGKTWQYSRDSNEYGATHNLAEDAQQTYDPVAKRYGTATQLSYKYNSFSQTTQAHSETFVSAIGGNYTRRYYYELYTPTAVAAVTAGKVEINVFPNPASTTLNLHVQWNDAQPFTIAIYDMQGRLLRQWGEEKTKDYSKQIPVSALPAGNYILKVLGENGGSQQQLSIVH